MIWGCHYFLHILAVLVATSLPTAAAGKGSQAAGGLDGLDKFCSKVFSSKDADAVDSIVDCSCCATSHLSGDYGSQVALQYGGKLSNADAIENGQAIGYVPAWSMGFFVPRVTCVDGSEGEKVMMCICEGKGNVKVDEPACRTGPQCTPPPRPEEGTSKPRCAQDNVINAKPTAETARVQAAVEDETQAAAGDETKKGLAESNADPEGKNKPPEVKEDTSESQNSCTFASRLAASTMQSQINFKKRMPLGSARCEDINPKQCGWFYAKKDDSWHHCESFIAPKTCKARLTNYAKAEENSKGIDEWAAKHAFIPGAWPVAIDADGTARPEKLPSIKTFEKFADNLPPRNMEGTIFE